MGIAAYSVGWWLLVSSLVFCALSGKLETHLIAQVASAFIVNCRLFNVRTSIRKK